MMRYVDLLTHKLSAGKMLESDKAGKVIRV